MLLAKKGPVLSAISVFIVAVICLSCSGRKITCDPPPDIASNEHLAPPTQNQNVDVYIDGTVSMEGFVLDGALSQYQQAIPMLERAVIRQGGQISFFKFGSNIVELPGRSYGDADRKNFYRDNSINRTTEIEKVIDRATTDRLTVVVTDLFQERADINQLTEKIKTKFLSADLAVGIMGIRSSYRGRIFDVGINNYSFDYSSNVEPGSLRPFYLLALGKAADISLYFDTLARGEMSGFPELQLLVFSRHLGPSVVSWRNAKIIDTRGVNEVTGVLVRSDGSGGDFREFRVRSNFDSPYIQAEIPFETLAGMPAFGGLRVTAERSFLCGPGSSTGNADVGQTDREIPSSHPASAVNVSEAAISDNKIKLKINVDSSKLERGSINGVRLVLRPDTYTLPEWVKEWNLSGEQVESFRSSPASFSGGKTYNLLPFIETLWEANRTVHNPKAADFYTYFRVD